MKNNVCGWDKNHFKKSKRIENSKIDTREKMHICHICDYGCNRISDIRKHKTHPTLGYNENWCKRLKFINHKNEIVPGKIIVGKGDSIIEDVKTNVSCNDQIANIEREHIIIMDSKIIGGENKSDKLMNVENKQFPIILDFSDGGVTMTSVPHNSAIDQSQIDEMSIRLELQSSEQMNELEQKPKQEQQKNKRKGTNPRKFISIEDVEDMQINRENKLDQNEISIGGEENERERQKVKQKYMVNCLSSFVLLLFFF